MLGTVGGEEETLFECVRFLEDGLFSIPDVVFCFGALFFEGAMGTRRCLGD
jgi:hypothetical protein